jgi:hypothetical protein
MYGILKMYIIEEELSLMDNEQPNRENDFVTALLVQWSGTQLAHNVMIICTRNPKMLTNCKRSLLFMLKKPTMPFPENKKTIQIAFLEVLNIEKNYELVEENKTQI